MPQTDSKRAGSPSEAAEFAQLTKRDALVRMENELSDLLKECKPSDKPLTEKEFDGFQKIFNKFLQGAGTSVEWDKIEKLPDGAVLDYENLKAPADSEVKAMLSKLVVVKLNGGLGTSMGCRGPKSVIPVRNDLSFLDLTVQQIEYLNRTYNADVPLVLMNSFNTDEDTAKVIRKYKSFNVKIYTFNQSRYPRVNCDSLTPVPKTCETKDDIDAWYPPGHGDFYLSFHNSELLKMFIEDGREYCFISNVDNLGATVDLNILNMLLHPENGKPRPEFLMELTDKTKADVKGGTLIKYEHHLRLLEIAQVPKEHVADFKSVKKFKIFNTNNLWIRLPGIQKIINDKTLDMDVIINNKTLDNGRNIIQLETAVGAAMKCFDASIGINVPRRRFLPVKKTSDLLLVMSNLYRIRSGTLEMSPLRMFPSTPHVKLGDNHFAKVKDFLKRFETIPDILELDHLTVSGDVTFGRGVSIRGTVIIIANHGERIDIPAGAILENKIVSGNLRILDH
jgi:UTP--glucose-1-phosphate uridylyltransferase